MQAQTGSLYFFEKKERKMGSLKVTYGLLLCGGFRGRRKKR